MTPVTDSANKVAASNKGIPKAKVCPQTAILFCSSVVTSSPINDDKVVLPNKATAKTRGKRFTVFKAESKICCRDCFMAMRITQKKGNHYYDSPFLNYVSDSIKFTRFLRDRL